MATNSAERLLQKNYDAALRVKHVTGNSNISSFYNAGVNNQVSKAKTLLEIEKKRVYKSLLGRVSSCMQNGKRLADLEKIDSQAASAVRNFEKKIREAFKQAHPASDLKESIFEFANKQAKEKKEIDKKQKLIEQKGQEISELRSQLAELKQVMGQIEGTIEQQKAQRLSLVKELNTRRINLVQAEARVKEAKAKHAPKEVLDSEEAMVKELEEAIKNTDEGLIDLKKAIETNESKLLTEKYADKIKDQEKDLEVKVKELKKLRDEFETENSTYEKNADKLAEAQEFFQNYIEEEQQKVDAEISNQEQIAKDIERLEEFLAEMMKKEAETVKEITRKFN